MAAQPSDKGKRQETNAKATYKRQRPETETYETEDVPPCKKRIPAFVRVDMFNAEFAVGADHDDCIDIAEHIQLAKDRFQWACDSWWCEKLAQHRAALKEELWQLASGRHNSCWSEKDGWSEDELQELCVDLSMKNMLNAEHALNTPHHAGGVAGNTQRNYGCASRKCPLDAWWEHKLSGCMSLQLLMKGIELIKSKVVKEGLKQRLTQS
jgi:hypothetical protein